MGKMENYHYTKEVIQMDNKHATEYQLIVIMNIKIERKIGNTDFP